MSSQSTQCPHIRLSMVFSKSELFFVSSALVGEELTDAAGDTMGFPFNLVKSLRRRMEVSVDTLSVSVDGVVAVCVGGVKMAGNSWRGLF